MRLTKTTNEVEIVLSKSIPFSILDVSSVRRGWTIPDALQHTIKLAKHAEALGFNRFWLAEHHNSPSIASSATSVLIGQVAAKTEKIRVGAGGIMLPNHASLAIAEQFGTLDGFYPDRIDLGLGRAPGTDPLTAKALRGERHNNGANFPEQLKELQGYMNPSAYERPAVRAFPGEGANVPIWLLGSSDFSAALAAQEGLPFSFAGHFSPTYIIPALNMYYNNFVPSRQLEKPYAMLAVNVIAAPTDEEAHFLATSMYQMFLGLVRSDKSLQAGLAPPVENMDELWSEQEKFYVMQQVGSSLIGSPQTIKQKLDELITKTNVDEIMVAGHIFDFEKKLKSIEIIADVFKGN